MFRRIEPEIELDALEAYALWAPTYPPEAHNALMKLEEAAMLELLPEVKGQTVLDLACGSGRYLAILIERGAGRVVGVDLSPQMLKRARTISPNLALADLRALPFASASFEVIVCGLAVGHLEDLHQAIREMGRILRPDGVVLYSDFHPFGSLAGWKRSFRASDGHKYAVRYHTHLYADHHAACCAAGLRIEEVREPRINFEHQWRGCPAAMVVRARKKTSG
jgi:malonyl-CoA O-methyltransferase